MAVNGVISFGQPPPEVMNSNEAFPTGTGAYLVAPFSSSLDLSSGGSFSDATRQPPSNGSQQVKNISFKGTWDDVPQLHFSDNLVS